MHNNELVSTKTLVQGHFTMYSSSRKHFPQMGIADDECNELLSNENVTFLCVKVKQRQGNRLQKGHITFLVTALTLTNNELVKMPLLQC